MNRIVYNITLSIFLSLLTVCCKNQEVKTEEPEIDARTPVTAVSVGTDPMSEYIELNATSAFLQKSYVKSNVNGYLQNTNAQLGKYVNKGQGLFSLKTKESQSIGNAINQLDSSFSFSGVNNILANANGFITQLNHQNGDYVQDGEQLAVISNMNSFVFLLDLPYELRPYLRDKKYVQIILPDGEKLNGSIDSYMPTVDAASQTQSIVIRVAAGHPIPENLIAKVRITGNEKTNSFSLPKSAVLTDETQNDFWVMKMIDSTTAIKVPVNIGIESGGRVEILSPRFSPNELILVSGNYGLADTAKVKIQKMNEQD